MGAEIMRTQETLTNMHRRELDTADNRLREHNCQSELTRLSKGERSRSFVPEVAKTMFHG